MNNDVCLYNSIYSINCQYHTTLSPISKKSLLGKGFFCSGEQKTTGFTDLSDQPSHPRYLRHRAGICSLQAR